MELLMDECFSIMWRKVHRFQYENDKYFQGKNPL